MAGIEDCYTQSRGSTATLGNFAMATYMAMARTYTYLTPDLWTETLLKEHPYQMHSRYLEDNGRGQRSGFGHHGAVGSAVPAGSAQAPIGSPAVGAIAPRY